VDERKVERVEVDGVELHLEPVDDNPGRDGVAHTALPPRIESWRRRSATGAILTGFAMGLKQVLEPERKEAAIVVQVSGEPVDDLAVEAQLNDLQPSESVVTVRPWLLAGPAADEGDVGVGPEPAGAHPAAVVQHRDNAADPATGSNGSHDSPGGSRP
jgi:hypothetical protein